MLSAWRLALTHPSASDHIYIGIYLQTANKAADRYRKNQNCAPLILVLSLLTMFLQQYILYTICVPMKHLRVYMYICIIEITYGESNIHIRTEMTTYLWLLFISTYSACAGRCRNLSESRATQRICRRHRQAFKWLHSSVLELLLKTNTNIYIYINHGSKWNMLNMCFQTCQGVPESSKWNPA